MKFTRRAFLKTGSTASLTAAALPTPTAEAAARRAGVRDFELDELTLESLQASLRSGRFTSRSLVRHYLERIEEIDRRGPALRSVIETNPDALATAASLDRERRERGPRGPLHGVPILLKDNIDTHDRLATSAGSLALASSIAPRDAFIVERLRAAGAVILGKTNLSEWANFRSTRSTSGWSGRGGQTRNPYVVDRNPSGSSSGSGAAVAASLGAVAVGTETDGSIVSPSSFCGVVGLKPTVGLVSRSGIIPISHTQDTAGPMARTVTDAAQLLGAMIGRDPRDSATENAPADGPRDYTRFLDPQGLRGARLGVVRRSGGFPEPMKAAIESLLAELRRQGAELIDPVELPGTEGVWRAEIEVLRYEFKAGLNAYLAALGPDVPVRTLADLIAFNERERNREMPWFGQEEFLASEAKGPLTEAVYLEAVATSRRLSREAIDGVFVRHRLDALVGPSRGPAHVTDLVNGDRDTGGIEVPAPAAGYPIVTVPAGFVFGLPFGFSFIGRAWTEPTLLRLAYGFEQAIQGRRPPRFLPTAEPA